jgi:hypothetical protein
VAALVGFDISTREITAAIVPLDPDTRLTSGDPVRFLVEPLTKTRDDGRRYQEIRTAVRHIFTVTRGEDVLLAYVERPYSRFAKAIAPMMGVYGAVMASIPSHVTRNGVSPSEWRSELGLPQRLSKQDAIAQARLWLLIHAIVADLTEHQAEALLVALAGRQINQRAFAA